MHACGALNMILMQSVHYSSHGASPNNRMLPQCLHPFTCCAHYSIEAVVKFDYEKQQEDELELKVGDVIANVTQV